MTLEPEEHWMVQETQGHFGLALAGPFRDEEEARAYCRKRGEMGDRCEVVLVTVLPDPWWKRLLRWLGIR